MAEECENCGRGYTIVYRVPNDVWAQIAPNKEALGNHPEHQYGGLLCPDCASEKAEELGVYLYFDASAGDWPENQGRA